jgi:hypothetical protein
MMRKASSLAEVDEQMEMSVKDDLAISARRADSLVLVSYSAYVKTCNYQALRQAAGHAYEAVHALMEADGIDAADAQELIARKLPGVCTVIRAAADHMASESAMRLCAVWKLMQLREPSPLWNDDERDVAMRLLVTALVSDDVRNLDLRERVGHAPHRRAAKVLVGELEHSELPWKAALLADAYRDLLHRYAPRSGAGRGRLCTALNRLQDQDRAVSMLASWLDGGGERETLSPCLDAVLAVSVPPVLV